MTLAFGGKNIEKKKNHLDGALKVRIHSAYCQKHEGSTWKIRYCLKVEMVELKSVWPGPESYFKKNSGVFVIFLQINICLPVKNKGNWSIFKYNIIQDVQRKSARWLCAPLSQPKEITGLKYDCFAIRNDPQRRINCELRIFANCETLLFQTLGPILES